MKRKKNNKKSQNVFIHFGKGYTLGNGENVEKVNKNIQGSIIPRQVIV